MRVRHEGLGFGAWDALGPSFVRGGGGADSAPSVRNARPFIRIFLRDRHEGLGFGAWNALGPSFVRGGGGADSAPIRPRQKP